MRDFIQETIDCLSQASENVKIIYDKFKKGEITQVEFEAEYHHIVADNVIDTIENETEYPNNGCTYNFEHK